ncbi:DUF2155 domain-containing protein [Phenylobacterium sp.]|uniref:DUF2155 domain-containing protein n=1 Tax=Phenylobacterium sp. TaxID=1871053 RepID=UPI002736A7F3|nr:DUF2155 domain-containing protein [Phenylobacterium sp.]MDP3659921.1 DUF2155 domain-containing protein [Phenylobacterium sp.]
MRLRRTVVIRVTALAAIGAGVLVAGLVSAQPAPPPITPAPVVPSTAAPVIEPVPGPVIVPPTPTEEAPPVDVPTPAPLATPPVQAAEVAPAAPPKAQVADKPAETLKRARYDVAILQALDKVTAENMRFEAEVGTPVRYKNLVFTVKACERAAHDEAVDDSMAYLIIESQPKAAPGKPTPAARQAFRGWMYASSPGLNPLEHPVYDAWVITCRATAPVVAAGSAPKSAPSTPKARPSLR